MKTVVKLFVLMTLMTLAAAPLSAQALLTAASGTSATLAATGHAELLGEFIVSVTSGTTAAGTLEVEISPVRLANDDTSGITVNGTGGLAGATILAVFEDQGLILIDFPGGPLQAPRSQYPACVFPDPILRLRTWRRHLQSRTT